MPVTRRIYNSKALYVSITGNAGQGGIITGQQLHRIQSDNHSWNRSLTDVNQYGNLAAIDRAQVNPPEIQLGFSYLLTDGTNESRIGFTTDGVTNAISGILNKQTDVKNYYVLLNENDDAANDSTTSDHFVYAFGNGFITNYSMNAAVGSFPTATVQVQALNVVYNSNSNGNTVPTIKTDGTKVTNLTYTLPTATSGTAGMPTALRYGDIEVSIPNVIGATFGGAGGAHIQSCTIDVPLSRTPLNRLGSRVPFSYEIDFPVTVTASITANVNDITTGNFADLVASCGAGTSDLSITIRECADAGQVGPIAMMYILKNATLDSQSYDGSIGPSDSVTLTFSSQLGAANDLSRGLFISGSA